MYFKFENRRLIIVEATLCIQRTIEKYIIYVIRMKVSILTKIHAQCFLRAQYIILWSVFHITYDMTQYSISHARARTHTYIQIYIFECMCEYIYIYIYIYIYTHINIYIIY